MDDVFLNSFIQRINKMIKEAEDPFITKDVMRGRLLDTLKWLYTDDSIQQLRMIQALMTFIYNTVGQKEGYASQDSWIDNLKCKVGYCTSRKYQRIVTTTCSKCDHKGEDRIEYLVNIPKSIAIGRCTQDERTKFVNDVIEYAQMMYDWFSFDDWRKHWETNSGTI